MIELPVYLLMVHLAGAARWFPAHPGVIYGDVRACYAEAIALNRGDRNQRVEFSCEQHMPR